MNRAQELLKLARARRIERERTALADSISGLGMPCLCDRLPSPHDARTPHPRGTKQDALKRLESLTLEDSAMLSDWS